MRLNKLYIYLECTITQKTKLAYKLQKYIKLHTCFVKMILRS